MRVVVGLSGSSGAIYGVAFLRRCPAEKYLIVSEWGREVLRQEMGMEVEELAPLVKRIYPDDDLAAPFASGSNRYDALVLIPCSLSTLGKIASGIADTLITRAAQVALKERMRVILALRETPLSSIALENALKLSREGVVIMPVAPPWYKNPKSMDDVVNGFIDKVLRVMDIPVPGGWRSEELDEPG